MKQLLVLSLLAALALALPAQAVELTFTKDDAISFVDTTCVALEKDAPGTIAKINKGEAPFVHAEDKSMYSFVYDLDVNVIAHPKADLVGKNFKGKPDVKGKMFRDEIVAVAVKDGTGWVDYAYQKPGEEGIHDKTTYCRKVKGSDGKDYVVSCGIYKPKQ